MSSVSTEVAKATRQALAEQPIPVSETTPEPEVPLYVDGLEVIPAKASTSDERRRGRRFTSGGHWWYTRDPHAGLRAYSRDRLVFKFWHGYLLVEVVDHFTHAPLASYLMPATRQEEGAYEDAFRQAESNLGGVRPFLVAGDRGYSYPHIYRFNASRGVGSVFPYRKFGRTAPDSLPATPLADKNGVPLCQKCGSDTEFVRFAVVRGKGRIWFRCPWPGCLGEQSILCEKAPRHLLPVWRTEDAYRAMRHSHWTYEHKHHDQRVNYKLGPSNMDSRPKRPGIAWQQLRASAAMLIEWLRIFQRGGLDGGPSHVGDPVETRTKSLRVLRLEALAAVEQLVASRDGPAPPLAA